MTHIPLLETMAGLERPFDVWFLDIWGVLHNGVRPFTGAVAACRDFRSQGGAVILVSNSPRPREGVARQLESVGVARDAYDAILTSGDVSRTLIAAYQGRTVFHLGPARDLPVYEGLGVTLGNASDAAAAVCTGLYDDETETPDDYADLLAACQARNLEMICVNPDLTADRAGRIIFCAGSLAAAYEALGGKVRYAGKPHKPIYDEAFRMAAALLKRDVPKSRVLAIGDGVKTDIGGALAAGVAAVYVASAVHMEQGETLSAAAARLFPDAQKRPIAVMTALA
ncbi:MAG: TIGR01459 family HAD-type hydrolase [Hyphomicrobium sp.]